VKGAAKRKAPPAPAAPARHKAERTPEFEKAMRRMMLSPSMKAAAIARKTIDYALAGGNKEESKFTTELHVGIEEIQAEVRAGKLDFLEGMLTAQACALDSLFCKLAVIGANQTDRNNLQVVVGLALRAQNGCRATIETLAAVKNPQGFTVVKQVNAAGVQQVNNGPAPASGPALACADTGAFSQTKVLEVMPSEPKRLDAGTTGADAGLDSLMGAVAQIDRPTHARGQSPRVPQRVEGRKTRRAARGTPTHART